MKTQPQADFPPELLQASLKQRVDYFKNRLIDHSLLSVAFNKAMAALGSSSGPRVVTITGPTGVGKTTLARRIYRQLMKNYEDEIAADPSMVPVLGINAIPPNGTSFNWKDFYFRLLEKNGDVLLDHKLNLPRQGNMFPELLFPPPSEGATADSLRRALEKCICKRGTKFLIVDEGHHLMMVKDDGRLEYQFESLKSLTIETDVIIVLVGTYRLLDIREHSGQLVRRSEVVPLSRYDFWQQGDKQSFASALATLQNKMPLEVTPDIVPDVEYFYLKTGGCIGILKDWLTRCLEQAILENRKTVDAEFASRFALDNKGLSTIIEEALAGESKLADVSLDSIKTLLTEGIPAVIYAPEDTKKKMTSKRRVGERNPTRDKTGGFHVAP
ncbi:MAG: ATP-binding protein [Betaproteobacteria bacterium]|nr:ATP-binding protein [Betaproteobacteria bacterium]